MRWVSARARISTDFGLSLLTPIIAVALVIASLSGLLDWLTGPSTGLLDIARQRGYRAPALLTICVVGTLASVAACVVGLFPPSQLGHITMLPYLLALLAGTLLVGILPPLVLHKLRRPEWKTAA